ncbi:MAG: polyhydroxyalkanoate synthesis regulator DNA-binding domain-containing protein [Planctomycetes bacterium]|nr:polyhydroxyalkanoate synthesis regulator DNA-binding domain-containing protein [Planctomycetota bacterium]HON45076.1 polyhydroxyalkanoate synthesis regulator DNA-binding domain-containing protein [Planctomycetota bacterium]HPY75057.1 polyhydroxyalkanoate synthesis regulator DNA-binding domain-containing protein [Planctomycetota bacterium]HQB00718.1 polyhydroxyalkanoate synthesis regulator DNA-binding domain-containing protein [Planctomycetota bacterium]HRU50724.1 polyhydroxyalkanoate synthes
MHYIKRYANRKMYDSTLKKYITFEEIEKFVQQNESIQIIDNETNEDITAAILSQIIANRTKKQQRYSSSFFAEILRKGSDSMYGYAKKIVHTIGETALSIEETITKENDPNKWEERLDFLMQFILDKFNIPTRKEFQQLEEKLTKLEKKIQKYLQK